MMHLNYLDTLHNALKSPSNSKGKVLMFMVDFQVSKFSAQSIFSKGKTA